MARIDPKLLSPAAKAAVRQLAPMVTAKPAPLAAAKTLSSDAPPVAPVGTQTETQFTTAIYTYFTKAGETRLLYSAQKWVVMKLRLETAGPVAVSNVAQVTPVLSGKGRLLPTSEEIKFTLGKGTRVYIAAEAVNRVSVTIEPIPYLEEILAAIAALGVTS